MDAFQKKVFSREREDPFVFVVETIRSQMRGGLHGLQFRVQRQIGREQRVALKVVQQELVAERNQIQVSDGNRSAIHRRKLLG